MKAQGGGPRGGGAQRYGCQVERPGMCLLLGAAGVGKTLLVKRLQNILPQHVGGQGPRQGGGHTAVIRDGNSVLCLTHALDHPNS